MTDNENSNYGNHYNNQNNHGKVPEDKDPKEMTDEELTAWREEKMKKRIEELRRRDPFIYR